MKTRAWLFGVLGALSIWSCDTASSIDPPENSFFVKFYGNNGNQEGVDAVLNVDGTITLFGTNEVGGIKQLYLVNIEQNGNVVWESTLTTPFSAIAKDIEVTNDGRLVVVADYLKATKDIFLATFTLGGVLIDSVSTGLKTNPPLPATPQPTNETAVSVTQTSDGFIVVGSSDNLDLKPNPVGGDTQDAIHIRYFNDLTIYPSFWRQAHGPGTFDSGVKIVSTVPDISGNEQFYYFGYSNTQNTDLNFYVLRLGSTGESNGPNDYLPGIPAADERLSSVAISPLQSGEGFIMMGTSKASGSADADIFILKLKRLLSLNSGDQQFQKNLAVNLGPISGDKTSIFASSFSGYFLLSNDKSTGVQNFYLNKIDNQGNAAWTSPLIFGGEMDDEIGAVLEMPDGSIGIIGTFAIGQDGEKKMTFIKVNKEGKFSK